MAGWRGGVAVESCGYQRADVMLQPAGWKHLPLAGARRAGSANA